MPSLFDLIYQFFESNIFNDNYGALLGDISYSIGDVDNSAITMEAWLCTTATIITISIITVLCFLFVFKIVKLIGGLIRG